MFVIFCAHHLFLYRMSLFTWHMLQNLFLALFFLLVAGYLFVYARLYGPVLCNDALALLLFKAKFACHSTFIKRSLCLVAYECFFEIFSS